MTYKNYVGETIILALSLDTMCQPYSEVNEVPPYVDEGHGFKQYLYSETFDTFGWKTKTGFERDETLDYLEEHILVDLVNSADDNDRISVEEGQEWLTKRGRHEDHCFDDSGNIIITTTNGWYRIKKPDDLKLRIVKRRPVKKIERLKYFDLFINEKEKVFSLTEGGLMKRKIPGVDLPICETSTQNIYVDLKGNFFDVFGNLVDGEFEFPQTFKILIGARVSFEEIIYEAEKEL